MSGPQRLSARKQSCAQANSKQRRLTQIIGRPAAALAIAAQAACAPSPESVQARYVSPNMYQNWSCDQLGDEKMRLTSEVQRVSGLQRENANADVAMMTVGIIILWPMLFGLAATKDRKDELGQLKGQYDAVDLSLRTRQCTLPPPALGTPGPPRPALEQATASTSFNGSYKAKGTTESWCLPPTLALNIKGDTIDGQLSEVASGATTSAVAGTVDGAGVVSLQFKASSTDYFTGKVDGALKGNTITLDIRTTTAKACSYHFELTRVPLVAAAPQ